MSGKTFIAKPLAPVDREAWDGLATQYGCLFDSLRWTDIFGPMLRRLGIYDAGGNLRGGFCVWEERRFGLCVLRNPPYTPMIGPFYEPRASNPAARTDEQRAVVEALADYLTPAHAAVASLGLSLGITDILPFYWHGWKVVPHYTYRIDLAQPEDALMAAMSKQQRNSINKAVKDGILVEEAADTSELRPLVLKTFARQSKALTHRVMDGLFTSYPPGKNSYCCIAKHQGVPIAGEYFVHDSRTAYALAAGYDEARAHKGAGALTMWNAILKAKEMGLKVFDFEGSVIPAIERYFRGFGGSLKPYFTVNRAWLPIEIALKLARRNVF